MVRRICRPWRTLRSVAGPEADPRVEQTLLAFRFGYEADKANIPNLPNSQNGTRNFQLDYYRVAVDFERRTADLERADGVEPTGQ